MQQLKKGIYRHFKGKEYRLISEALNSETKEDFIIYQDVKNEDKIWVRPKKIFLEEVEVDGKIKPRFKFLEEELVEPWEHRYKRALADYQNLLKQTTREKEEFFKYALTDFLHDLLPIYDHLKMSLIALNDDEVKNPWVEGVKHVLKQFKEVLNDRGIEEIRTLGEKFDHHTMEALEGKGEKVKQEVIPGYKLNGRVIRPAKVVVE